METQSKHLIIFFNFLRNLLMFNTIILKLITTLSIKSKFNKLYINI